MKNILEKIINDKKQSLELIKKDKSLNTLEKKIKDQNFINFKEAIQKALRSIENNLDGFTNINPPNGYNAPHIHPNSLFSGVYYVKAPENSGDLVCNEPRAGAQLNMPVRKPGKPPKHLWREVHLKPIEGRIIMFPYYLWHNVEPNLSNAIFSTTTSCCAIDSGI